MSDRSAILVQICAAVAAAVNQCQALAVAAVDLCPQQEFDKLGSLSIRVTPFKSAISSDTRASTVRMDAQVTIWIADPGGEEAVAPGIMLVEDIANGIFRRRLELAGGGQAVATRSEIVTVYDLDRLRQTHVFLSALRVHVTAWYKP